MLDEVGVLQGREVAVGAWPPPALGRIAEQVLLTENQIHCMESTEISPDHEGGLRFDFYFATT